MLYKGIYKEQNNKRLRVGGFKMIHCLSWYNNKHKFYRKDLDYLMLLAYEKAFYFSDVKIDGVRIEREF